MLLQGLPVLRAFQIGLGRLLGTIAAFCVYCGALRCFYPWIAGRADSLSISLSIVLAGLFMNILAIAFRCTPLACGGWIGAIVLGVYTGHYAPPPSKLDIHGYAIIGGVIGALLASWIALPFAIGRELKKGKER
jgi:hypothetical protein